MLRADAPPPIDIAETDVPREVGLALGALALCCSERRISEALALTADRDLV
ncbi:MAG: hypothetical protein AAF684_10265 [Pseudomonadota bacterium]